MAKYIGVVTGRRILLSNADNAPVELVQNDKDTTIIDFELSKIDYVADLSQLNVAINYVNVDKDTGESVTDIYTVDKTTVEGDSLKFSWLVGSNASVYAGKCVFQLVLTLVDADGVITQQWDSTKQSIEVHASLENVNITQPKSFVDLVTQVKKSVSDAVASGVTDDRIKQIVEQHFEENPVQVTTDNTLSVAGTPADALATGTAVDSLKEDLIRLDDKLHKICTENLFNGVLYENKGLSYDGKVIDFDGYNLSDYIDISLLSTFRLMMWANWDTVINIGLQRFVFYDSLKEYISKDAQPYNADGDIAWDIPANAKYVRFVIKSSDANLGKIMIMDYKPKKYIPYMMVYSDKIFGDVLPTQWKNKNWLAYGDSITAISNGNGLELGWSKYVNDKLGFSNFYGRGVGGQTYTWNTSKFQVDELGRYVTRGTSADNCKGCMCSWERVSKMIPNSIKDTIDLIVLMAGTNDLSGVEEIAGGSTIDYVTPVWSDTYIVDTDWVESDEYNGGDYNVSTFCGAIASTIMKLQIRCPNAIIVLATPLARWDIENHKNYEVNGKCNMDVAETEIKVARYMSIPQIDVNGNCGINGYNYRTYITDGVHPYNDDGKKMLARTIVGGLYNIYSKSI